MSVDGRPLRTGLPGSQDVKTYAELRRKLNVFGVTWIGDSALSQSIRHFRPGGSHSSLGLNLYGSIMRGLVVTLPDDNAYVASLVARKYLVPVEDKSTSTSTAATAAGQTATETTASTAASTAASTTASQTTASTAAASTAKTSTTGGETTTGA